MSRVTIVRLSCPSCSEKSSVTTSLVRIVSVECAECLTVFSPQGDVIKKPPKTEPSESKQKRIGRKKSE